MEPQQQPVQSKVLDAIKSGQVCMRPRWRFVLQTGLYALGASIMVLALFFLLSFIIFGLRANGGWFAPEFGARGWLALVRVAPWALLLLAILFIALLELLVRHYGFGYRQPLLYSLGGVLILVIAGSAALAHTPLHPRLAQFADRHRVPLAGPIYESFCIKHLGDIQHGTLAQFVTSGFTLTSRDGQTLIVVTSSSHYPRHSELAIGDGVMVVGRQRGGRVQAVGVRKLGAHDDEIFLRPHCTN